METKNNQKNHKLLFFNLTIITLIIIFYVYNRFFYDNNYVLESVLRDTFSGIIITLAMACLLITNLIFSSKTVPIKIGKLAPIRVSKYILFPLLFTVIFIFLFIF